MISRLELNKSVVSQRIVGSRELWEWGIGRKTPSACNDCRIYVFSDGDKCSSKL